MYSPTINKVTNFHEIFRFVQKHSFGLIINVSDKDPMATHLPFHFESDGEKMVIFGHFAKANDQWKSLEKGKTLVVFSEPHAYISPSHYDHEQNVPTWNYCSVQCCGRATIIMEEDKCMKLMRDLIAVHDQAYLHQWDTKNNDDYKTKMLKGVVMFRIDVEDIQAKYKLSQNKSTSEQQRVSKYLIKQEDSNAREIGMMMSKSLELKRS